MLTFTIAVFFLLITPGPGVLSTAGVGSGFGYRAGVSFLAGLFVGSNLVALLVISGLAALLLSVPWLRTGLLIGSVGYLVYLAWRIAFSGSQINFIHKASAPGFINGVTLQAINPKAYLVNTALFTGFAFWPQSLLTETLIKFAIINLIWVPIHVLWLWFGVTLRRLQLPGRVQAAINAFMALSMLIVVGLALWAQR
ncbi:MAG: LysE family translocator [Burkholderiaceae bacterium]|nr:LysE family translocator [Burkholderiaceae bacterium]MBP7661725.1 LysE family translocator [Burkholderiaceae bacterium]